MSGRDVATEPAAVREMIALGEGYMERVRSLPVAAAAPLAGTVLAEMARGMTALALAAVGYGFGFRYALYSVSRTRCD